jgi:hypothetical protein
MQWPGGSQESSESRPMVRLCNPVRLWVAVLATAMPLGCWADSDASSLAHADQLTCARPPKVDSMRSPTALLFDSRPNVSSSDSSDQAHRLQVSQRASGRSSISGPHSSATSSSLVLVGTIRLSSGAIALISVDGRPADLFSPGQEITPGVVLREVQSKGVVLARAGQLEVLRLGVSNDKPGATDTVDSLTPQNDQPATTIEHILATRSLTPYAREVLERLHQTVQSQHP